MLLHIVIIIRKAGHVHVMDKKEHQLANLGQFKDETPLNNMQS